MENPKKKSESVKSKAADAPANSPKPVNVRRKFEDAHYNYMQALREAHLEAHQRAAQANHNYLQAEQEIQTEAQRHSWEAYLAYVKALQDITEPGDMKASEEARSTYEQNLHQVHIATQKRLLEAHQSYIEALSDTSAQEDVKQSVEEAFRGYLRALQQVWANVDVNTLDPGSLAAISHNIATTALSACGTLGDSGRTGK